MYPDKVRDPDLAVYVEPGRFMFMKVPKVAGTSIKNVIPSGYINSRLNHSEFIEWVDAGEKVYSFAFVRNPFDRVKSSYKYLNSVLNLGIGFDNFVEKIVSEDYDDSNRDDIIRRHVIRQKNFIFDGIDFIGRFENIVSDWKTVSKATGLPRNLPVMNVSKRSVARYNRKTMNAVRDYYFEDIKQFGYREYL